MRAQGLTNVCSTVHLHHLQQEDAFVPSGFVEDQLTKLMGRHQSAIMIVGNGQTRIKRVLNKWSKRKEGMIAVNCGKVTRTGTLWKISRFN